MKQIKVKVQFYIEGNVIVNANNKTEAKEIIEKDIGLCLGRNIHVSTDKIVDWEFPIHFEKKIKNNVGNNR